MVSRLRIVDAAGPIKQVRASPPGYLDNILRMWRANRSLISRWRGTGWENLVTGF